MVLVAAPFSQPTEQAKRRHDAQVNLKLDASAIPRHHEPVACKHGFNGNSASGRKTGYQRMRSAITAESAKCSHLPAAPERARLCARVAAEHRGRDVLLIDLRKLTTLVDYFVIASGTSRRQIHAMADEIERAMNQLGDQKIGIEGYGESRWVLLDYRDIVVHLFDDDTRSYYDLENLWGDAPRVEWNQTS